MHGTNPQALASLDLSGHAAFGTKADLATVAGGGTAREEEVQQVRLPQPNLSASAAVEGAQVFLLRRVVTSGPNQGVCFIQNEKALHIYLQCR